MKAPALPVKSGERTNDSRGNEREEVPLFGGLEVVRDEDQDDVAEDLGDQEEKDAELPAEGVAPGAEVEGEEDGKDARHDRDVNVELGDLETSICPRT